VNHSCGYREGFLTFKLNIECDHFISEKYQNIFVIWNEPIRSMYFLFHVFIQPNPRVHQMPEDDLWNLLMQKKVLEYTFFNY